MDIAPAFPFELIFQHLIIIKDQPSISAVRVPLNKTIIKAWAGLPTLKLYDIECPWHFPASWYALIIGYPEGWD